MKDVDELAHFSTANVSDVLQSLRVLSAGIKPLDPRMRLIGPAHTVKAYPGSILSVHKALAEAEAGAVLVVDGEGDVGAGALFGEIMALQARTLGLGGLVVDGPIRDVEGIVETGFPVFARQVTPRVGTNRRLGATQVPISCGGIVISPGDIVFGDSNGVVCVPKDDISTVLVELQVLRKKEDGLVAGIKEGRHVADMLGFRDSFR